MISIISGVRGRTNIVMDPVGQGDGGGDRGDGGDGRFADNAG